jgi:hypothetical protein
VGEGTESRPLIRDEPDRPGLARLEIRQVLRRAARVQERRNQTEAERRSEASGATSLGGRVAHTKPSRGGETKGIGSSGSVLALCPGMGVL